MFQAVFDRFSTKCASQCVDLYVKLIRPRGFVISRSSVRFGSSAETD